MAGLRRENLLPISLTAKEISLPETDAPAPATAQDAELANGCREGNIEAFERLYELHGPRMKSIALNLLGNVADAEDAVQEAFLKVYRAARSFRGRSSFSTWVYRVLVNTCYDVMRRGRRRPESVPTEEDDFSPTRGTDHPLRLSLEQCLARLRPRHRSVFLLFEVEGFSHREIGEILEVAEGTSKTLLFAAKRELQGMLWSAGAAARAAS